MNRQITCIICPRGCRMTVGIHMGEIEITGNSCPRGKEYAIGECTHPVRTITSSVRVINRKYTMISVKTAAPVPKEKTQEIMNTIRSAQVSAPVFIGDVILAGVCGTDVVATNEIL